MFRATLTFGEGTGPIFLDDLHCSGQEDRLVDCPYFSCQHDEDAGVTCSKGAWHTSILILEVQQNNLFVLCMLI